MRVLGVLVALATLPLPCVEVSAGAAVPSARAGDVSSARTILAAFEASRDDLGRAIDASRTATIVQAGIGGWEVHPAAAPISDPDVALARLISAAGIAVTPAQLEQIERTRSLSLPARRALAAVISSFTAYRRGVTDALSGIDRRTIDRIMHPERQPGFQEAAPTINFGDALGWRTAMLDAVRTLPSMLVGERVRIAIPPLISIDTGTDDSTYTTDYALLVDGGGNDVYLNNAGGSGRGTGQDFCSSSDLPEAAALIDLGGNDSYGYPDACGVTGAGALGAGTLVDAAGNDVYRGRDWSIGSGTLGIGMIVDAAGDDLYEAGPPLDPAGVWADTFINGSGAAGSGLIIDASGNDRYLAGPVFTNGSGGIGGSGMIVDAGGDDRYETERGGTTNGSGSAGGHGALIDGGGNDLYIDTGGGGANGGGIFGGAGMVFDLWGNDGYFATNLGVNGGSYCAGSGLLVDGAGDDQYVAGSGGTNGEADPGCFLPLPLAPGTGSLIDGGGRDTYTEAGSTVADHTVAPKGIAGAQIDLAG